jgi:hypothetical protein
MAHGGASLRATAIMPMVALCRREVNCPDRRPAGELQRQCHSRRRCTALLCGAQLLQRCTASGGGRPRRGGPLAVHPYLLLQVCVGWACVQSTCVKLLAAGCCESHSKVLATSGSPGVLVQGSGFVARFDSLSPSACCRVGDPELGWSDEFNFTMPPEAHQVMLS